MTLPQKAAIPEDLSVVVRYQGSLHEAFPETDPEEPNFDVCCRLGAPVSGALPEVRCGQSYPLDAAQPTAILCELWTGDLPQITVSADGYPDLIETLKGEPRPDDCGLETVDVRLTLTPGDGGRG